MHKSCYLLLFIVLKGQICVAGEPIYPKRVMEISKLPFKTVAQRNLPAPVFFWVSQGLESNEDPEFHGRVAYADLNGDRVNEIIVTSQSKTWNVFDVWHKQEGRWIDLLQVDGVTHLSSKRNGYYQIEVWREDRWGEGTRELYAFKGKRYHVTRIDKYKDGSFMGAVDTQDRENVLAHNFNEQLKAP